MSKIDAIDRKKEEKEFHDKLRLVNGDEHVADTRYTAEMEETIRDNPLWVNMKYYSIERKSREMVLKWFGSHCKGKTVLDLCCGNGDDGRYIAGHGAKRVVGMDISDISIENCRNAAGKMGLNNIEYKVGDAENMDFSDNTFDVITEYGAMHHIDLDKTYAEMVRVLKSDGCVICNEALGHNPVIHAYRRLTPSLRTAYEVEHILRREDFAVAHKYFQNVEMRFFHLFSLLAVPFRRWPGFSMLLCVLEAIDAIILKLPLIKWQAWQVVYVLSGPRKDVLSNTEKS